LDHIVRSFDLFVALRVRDRGIINLDSCILAEVCELPRSKMGSIIGDYVVGDAEPVHDLRDEFHCLDCYYGSCRVRFDPFSELAHCYEDVCESTFGLFKWTYQI
jgi:hypothetical protein